MFAFIYIYIYPERLIGKYRIEPGRHDSSRFILFSTDRYKSETLSGEQILQILCI